MDYDHNTIITPKGQYQYDPDYDCYYRIAQPEDLTHWARFGWLWVMLMLGIVAYAVS